MKPLGRTVAAGLVGLVMAAGALFGAGTATAADTLVVDQPLAVVRAEVGQLVAIAPSTLDSKVRDAVLLAMPLAFGPADDAAQRFAALPPIPLGPAAEGRTFYSGRDIAEAASPRLAEIGLPAAKVDAVTWHFTNLVSLGNALTVRAEPAEAPSSPPTSEQPRPTPPPQHTPAPPTSRQAPVPPSQAAVPPPAAPPSTPTPGLAPSSAAPAAISVLPPDLRSAPGAVPPWAPASHDQVPGLSPDLGDLARQQRAREQEEIRAAGRAEALPTEVTERVAAPVLIAAISLAVVTAGLIRSWVLRRQ
ncbi:hypothetical protein GCM10011581_41510 [Saccharopolyspora subtropica]|uniref:Uncharacterized protein n=1 Tax=Saccharopolyspora thermophila TaxID=89367 RepID=A0A917NIC3_9PSEU|nr:hypothetical protein [Saccharopolyspora subtropica]GGJ00073.1 hypothetical protein GCM10011581_41510 [Saccharopolyspora subtropica]